MNNRITKRKAFHATLVNVCSSGPIQEGISPSGLYKPVVLLGCRPFSWQLTDSLGCAYFNCKSLHLLVISLLSLTTAGAVEIPTIHPAEWNPWRAQSGPESQPPVAEISSCKPTPDYDPLVVLGGCVFRMCGSFCCSLEQDNLV